MFLKISILALILACAVPAVSAISVKDVLRRITSRGGGTPESSNEVRLLPGFRNRLPSKHFSGYITVDEDHGRQLFYYLVESEVPSDRLILWLTGGPGCSSMDAFTYEHGPFTYSFKPGSDAPGRSPGLSDITLTPNPHAWAKVASVLYIDSPAGTGLSYSAAKSDYVTNDSRTIDDLELFVASFFQQYPALRHLQLYIAGESYAGVYVPLLTQRLLHHNQRLAAQPPAAAAADNHHSSSSSSSDDAVDSSSSSSSDDAVDSSSSSSGGGGERYNLAGYIVGNAVTDDAYDNKGQVDFAYGLGLIDPLTYEDVRKACKASDWDAGHGSACAAALDRMEAVMGPINQYDILGQCYFHPDNDMRAAGPSSRKQAASLRRSWPYAAAFPQPDQPITNMYALHKAAAAAGSGSSRQQLGHTISCADRRHALIYYNHPTVRRAIHAASIEEAGRWEPCSDVLHYTHTAGSMIPVHRELVQAGLQGLVLSGDHDYVVPFTSSRAWVYDLGFKEAVPWHSWSLPGSKQVSGYAVEFDVGLTFATVKGGGHMVPQTKPQESLALLQLWLDNKL